MVLQCHMKGKTNIMYLKNLFVTLLGVNNSDSFMVKTQTGFFKSCIYVIGIGILLRLG